MSATELFAIPERRAMAEMEPSSVERARSSRIATALATAGDFVDGPTVERIIELPLHRPRSRPRDFVTSQGEYASEFAGTISSVGKSQVRRGKRAPE